MENVIKNIEENILNSFQKDILKECLEKKNGGGGLSLPLGSGKTIISLVLSLKISKNKGPILIILSKSLISNWENEIKKFFPGDILKYEIVHNSYIDVTRWKIKKDTKVVFTTPQMLSKMYKQYNINVYFVDQQFMEHQVGNLGAYVNFYAIPEGPFLNHSIGGGFLYSINWGCLIVDEIQAYLNIESLRCQALASLCAKERWALSGTMFDEPKDTKILGYYMILNIQGVPRNLPGMKRLLGSKDFKGYQQTLVHREKNEAFKPPVINESVIYHKLTENEKNIYEAFRTILMDLNKKSRDAQIKRDYDQMNMYNAGKLTMILYLRQVLLCPAIPVSSVIIDSTNTKEKDKCVNIVKHTIMNNVVFKNYINDKNNIISSRTRKVLDKIEVHKNERIIIFSCFKTYLYLLEYLISEQDKQRDIFMLSSNKSIKKRGEIIKEFEQNANGILLLTYELGGTGLNLQFCKTMLLTDFSWNSKKTQQAVGRIYRLGQKAEKINVYFFVSNTRIENSIFKKHHSKDQIVEELRYGPKKSKVETIKVQDIIRMIALNENKTEYTKLKNY